MVAYTQVVRLVFRYAPQAWSATRTLREAAALWSDNKEMLKDWDEQRAEREIRDWCQEAL